MKLHWRNFLRRRRDCFTLLLPATSEIPVKHGGAVWRGHGATMTSLELVKLALAKSESSTWVRQTGSGWIPAELLAEIDVWWEGDANGLGLQERHYPEQWPVRSVSKVRLPLWTLKNGLCSLTTKRDESVVSRFFYMHIVVSNCGGPFLLVFVGHFIYFVNPLAL